VLLWHKPRGHIFIIIAQHTTLGILQDELSRINDSVAERKALLELKEAVKKQGNMLAQLQSIIIAQSEENNELNVKLEAQDLETASSYVFSPPFYSSPGGYKLCYMLCIKVHTSGNGKGTHLSVCAYLMRGDNDDHLPWPFTGSVEAELLNRLKDCSHRSNSIKFRKSLYRAADQWLSGLNLR
jgi:hypothetical protein